MDENYASTTSSFESFESFIKTDELKLTSKAKLCEEERLKRRREKNKLHARNTRDRKKQQIDELELRIEELIDEKLKFQMNDSKSSIASILISLGNGSSKSNDEDSQNDMMKKSAQNTANCTLEKLRQYVSNLLMDSDDLDFDHDLLQKDRSSCTTAELALIRRERNRMHAKKTRLRKKKIQEEMELIIARLEKEIVQMKTKQNQRLANNSLTINRNFESCQSANLYSSLVSDQVYPEESLPLYSPAPDSSRLTAPAFPILPISAIPSTYIANNDDTNYYFHPNSILNINYDNLLLQASRPTRTSALLSAPITATAVVATSTAALATATMINEMNTNIGSFHQPMKMVLSNSNSADMIQTETDNNSINFYSDFAQWRKRKMCVPYEEDLTILKKYPMTSNENSFGYTAAQYFPFYALPPQSYPLSSQTLTLQQNLQAQYCSSSLAMLASNLPINPLYQTTYQSFNNVNYLNDITSISTGSQPEVAGTIVEKGLNEEILKA